MENTCVTEATTTTTEEYTTTSEITATTPCSLTDLMLDNTLITTAMIQVYKQCFVFFIYVQ